MYPICILIGKETSENMRKFFPRHFQGVQDAVESGLKEKYGYNVELAHNADLSAQWKFLGKGRAFKRKTYPCHCCAITDKDMMVPNEGQCRICATINHRNANPNFQCYHKDMLTAEKVQSLKHISQQLSEKLKDEEGINNFKECRSRSTLNMNENPRLATAQDKCNSKSIHFDISFDIPPQVTVEFVRLRTERREYASKITSDLAERGMDFSTGSFLQRQRSLKSRLITEWQYLHVLDQIRHGELTADTAVQFHLLSTVPCILHAENRMGLKLMTTLLRIGL